MEQIPEEIRKIFKGLEDDVIEAILKRMEKIQEIIPASDYQLWRLDQIGSLRSDVKKKIQDALKLSKKEINKIYSETMKQDYVRDKRIYDELGTDQIPYEENEPLQQLIEAVKMQTEEEFKNITGTMGFITPTGPKLVEKEFTDLMDKALMEVSTGSFDYSTAIRTAVDEMVNSGVRWIDYESGHHNRVDVATRRALMTGVRQVTGKIVEMNAESLGTDKYEVSAHATARPDHQVWQGKVYTYDELVSVCGLGTGPGLCGWNCYHFYDPFYEGISVRKYTDEQLEQMNADANKKASYGNKEYTKYEATQEQRRLETQMRGLREKISLLKKYGGRKVDIQNKEIKYNEYMARYKDFSEKMDLPFQPERIRTSNWSKQIKSGNVISEQELNDLIGSATTNGRVNINFTPPSKEEMDSLTFDDHAKHHGVDFETAKTYIENALFTVTRYHKWTGVTYVNYYSHEGAAYVAKARNAIRTCFSKDDFDEPTKEMIRFYDENIDKVSNIK